MADCTAAGSVGVAGVWPTPDPGPFPVHLQADTGGSERGIVRCLSVCSSDGSPTSLVLGSHYQCLLCSVHVDVSAGILE